MESWDDSAVRHPFVLPTSSADALPIHHFLAQKIPVKELAVVQCYPDLVVVNMGIITIYL